MQTNQRLNIWHTELHLSFFCTTFKRYNDDDDGEDLDNAEEDDPFVYKDTGIACPGDESLVIEKCIISFHFLGDLNDRVWTCHVLTYKFTGSWFADEESFNLIKPIGEGNQTDLHTQRKILEARFFASAAAIIVRETRNVLNYVSGAINKDVSKVHHAPM